MSESVISFEEAEEILESTITAWAPEHGYAWEMLLMLQGKIGPSEFFREELEKRGHHFPSIREGE